jgi:hypothetical protein
VLATYLPYEKILVRVFSSVFWGDASAEMVVGEMERRKKAKSKEL